MSEWYPADNEDISFNMDTEEVDVFVLQNDFGSAYTTLTFDQIREIYFKVGRKTNLYELSKKLTEIVGSHLDIYAQREEGIMPPCTDYNRWKERYIEKYTNPPMLLINRFKPEVDSFVARIMNVIETCNE